MALLSEDEALAINTWRRIYAVDGDPYSLQAELGWTAGRLIAVENALGEKLGTETWSTTPYYQWARLVYGAARLIDPDGPRSARRDHPEWLRILAEHERRCYWCGRGDVVLQRDHVVSVRRLGFDRWDNIVPACQPCNRGRTAFGVKQYAQQLRARGVISRATQQISD